MGMKENCEVHYLQQKYIVVGNFDSVFLLGIFPFHFLIWCLMYTISVMVDLGLSARFFSFISFNLNIIETIINLESFLSSLFQLIIKNIYDNELS